jgi:hypothetical protein
VNGPGVRRIRLGLAAVALAAIIGYFVNHVNIDTVNWTWEQEYLFGAATPAGIDFRHGLYEPAQVLIRGGNPYTDYGHAYPPFSLLVGIPFQLLDENIAYLVHIWLLLGMNIACLWIALSVSKAAFSEQSDANDAADHVLAFPLFCVLVLWLVTSYGFLFSIERGNFDIYTQVAALGGLWLMVKRPKSLWLQVLCFSVAAHLKVYPAILFALVLWKHGRKSLLPLAVVNLAFLLYLGPANVGHFLASMTGMAQWPFLSQGNHSAASFANMVNHYLSGRGMGQVPTVLFYIAPVAIWLTACIYLVRRKFSAAGAAWLYMCSVPMMNLIPPTSHDYKLVLLGAPLAMLLFLLMWQYGHSGSRIRALQIVVVAVLMTMLALSYTRVPVVVGNKYPFVIALQAVLLWALVTPVTVTAPENPRDEARPTAPVQLMQPGG